MINIDFLFSGKLYMSWLALVTLAFLYNCTVIPLRGVFPYQNPTNLYYWMIFDYICDFIYLIDIILFKSRVQFVNEGLLEVSIFTCLYKITIYNIFMIDMAYITIR